MHLCDHSTLLRSASLRFAPLRSACQYVFLCAEPPWQPLDSFSSVAPKIWNALPGYLLSIPTLPAFRRALKHHFFLSAYPDSRTSGGITPSERITLRDTTPPAAIVLIENTMRLAKRAPPERLRLAKVAKPTYRLHIGARVNAALLTYLLTYLPCES